ncbi:MAG: GlcNAc-PI de-N-acetylase [Acidobacteria bacterium]|nr:MAG: GlcNAc-PI de-N-acetylase [Acidobacteriota bacterium]
MTKFADERKGRVRVRIGVITLSLSALVVLALAFSGAVGGQSPAATSSASGDPNSAAAAPWEWPTPDARPLEIDRGAAGLWQTLLKLHTRASLLMLVAHPDDEDGGMLTYESRGQGARATLLTLNRGEGGQNVMSDDFWDALGLVRTEELLAADRYYDVQQFWTTVADFGFSKTREEALEVWGHDRLLEDAVRVVRMTRPLVITSVFVGGPSDGHGQHAAAGQIAQEVFAAAGDPNVFPEQIRAGLRPWSPVKMYARVPIFPITDKGMLDSATGKYHPVRFYDFIHKSWSEGPLSANLQIPEGDGDPVLGASFTQIARQGWSLQKSQNGGGGIPLAAPVAAPYHRFGSSIPAADKEQSYFDGVDISIGGIADLAAEQDNAFLKEGLSRLNSGVERAMAGFSVSEPEKIAPLLAEGLKETNALLAQLAASKLSDQAKYDVSYELRAKQDQFQEAIRQALNLSLEATVAPEREPNRGNPLFALPAETMKSLVPGGQFVVRVHLNNAGTATLALNRISLETPAGESWNVSGESAVPTSLEARHALDQRFNVKPPQDAAPTRPYFSRPNEELPYYDKVDERYRNFSFAPYPLAAWVEFTYMGVPLRVGQVIQSVQQQTGQGIVLNPLEVTPAVSVRIFPDAGITPLGSKSFALSAQVHTEAQTGAKGTVRLDLPEGWHSEPASAPFALERAGEEQIVRFEVIADRLETKPYTVTAVAESGGRQYREGFITAGYPGLRPYNLYVPATYRTSGVDVKISQGLRVGYVMGTGDTVPQSLADLGVHVQLLNAQDISSGDLQRFDVILLGVRAYTARPELVTNHNRLLEYVRNGGVVIVQYQSVQYDHNFGPYPYTLPNDAERVVDEHSPVAFVDPKSPVLTWPNQINQSDFAGWVEERGHSFLKTWDPQYVAPLETHDPDQDPQKGGLVYARYGRGVYVYVAFALYRQLPDGVSGAYRLFANLLSLPRNPAFKQPGGNNNSARR